MDNNQNFRINLRSDRQFSSLAREREAVMPGGNQTYPSFRKPELSRDETKLITKILDKIVGFSIFAIFFGLPLFFTGLTLQGIVFEKQLYFYFWLLLGLVAWAARGVIVGEMNICRTPLDIPVVGFWLAYLLATIFSVDRWHSFWGSFGDPSRGFMGVTAMVIAYYLILSNFSGKRMRLITIAIVSSGAILSIWTLLGTMGVKFLPDKIAQYAPLSLVGTISGLGMFFSVMIPVSTMAALKVAENEDMKMVKRKIFLGGILLIIALDLFLILTIYNFVPWLGLFIGIALFLIFILAKIVRPKMSWTWLPMVVFILIMIIKMIGEVQIARVTLPIEVSPAYQPSWNIAKESIKDNFILGSGPATYGYDFSLHRPQDFNLNNFYNLRFLEGTGIFFEAVPTIGSLGVIVMIIMILSFVSVEMYLMYREKEKNKLYSLGFFSATVILIIDSLGTKIEGTILMLAILLGILSVASIIFESETRQNYLSLSLKASPKFALALAFVFMVVSAGVAFLFVFLGKVYIADVYAGSANRTIGADQEMAVSKMGRAIGFYGKEGKYYAQLGQYYMIMANNEAMKGEKERDVSKIQQLLNYSIAATRQGTEITKNDVNSVEVLAQIYENAGLYVSDSLSLALDTYKRGLELEPHNPNFYLKIGQIQISQASLKKDEQERKKQVMEASDSFQSSIKEKNNFAPGYYQLSLAQDALKETDASIENATKAAQINPQNIDYLLNLARLYQSRGKDEDMKTAEQIYKAIITQNDKDINGHFYLGLLYDKMKRRNEAKDELRKVISLLPENSQDTQKQIEKMIANIDAGIENTPQSLGLVQPENQNNPAETTGQEQPSAEQPSVEQ